MLSQRFPLYSAIAAPVWSRPLWLEIAQSNGARLNSLAKLDRPETTAEQARAATDWAQEHGRRIESAVLEYLPRGSGFDGGTQFDFDGSTKSRLIFQTAFHHMDESGMYDGWTEHRVTLSPALDGFPALKVSGRDRNGIKEYIAEVFHAALRQTVACIREPIAGPIGGRVIPVESIPEGEALEAAATLWEAVLEAARLEESEAIHRVPPPGGFPAPLPRPVSATLERHGYCTTRRAFSDMAAALHIGWTHAARLGYDSPFDWEFSPAFLARAIALDPTGEALPALLPDWLDACREIATLDGARLQNMKTENKDS